MQLISYENLTKENILFREAKEYKVKDSKFKYQRIKISRPNIQTKRTAI